MIREFNPGNLEIGNPDLRAVEDIIQLTAWCPAGVGGLSMAIGIF